jgi:hypothetical protein
VVLKKGISRMFRNSWPQHRNRVLESFTRTPSVDLTNGKFCSGSRSESLNLPEHQI